jgi:hypothetical protein
MSPRNLGGGKAIESNFFLFSLLVCFVSKFDADLQISSFFSFQCRAIGLLYVKVVRTARGQMAAT